MLTTASLFSLTKEGKKKKKDFKEKISSLVTALPSLARCDKASISTDHWSIAALLTVVRMLFSSLCLPFSPVIKGLIVFKWQNIKS